MGWAERRWNCVLFITFVQFNPTPERCVRRMHPTAVFSDENAITIEDDFPGEERFVTIGSDALGRVLVVVYTYREDIIRIISARRATSGERKQYEE